MGLLSHADRATIASGGMIGSPNIPAQLRAGQENRSFSPSWMPASGMLFGWLRLIFATGKNEEKIFKESVPALVRCCIHFFGFKLLILIYNFFKVQSPHTSAKENIIFTKMQLLAASVALMVYSQLRLCTSLFLRS